MEQDRRVINFWNLVKNADFLYKDEGHTFLKIENILEAETKRVKFLAKALEK
jgi:hypothetical protein